jgi:hypothetical protein
MSSPESVDDLDAESDLNISVNSIQLSIASLFPDSDTDFSEHSNTSEVEDEALSNHYWTDEDEDSVSSECDSPPVKRKRKYSVFRLCH